MPILECDGFRWYDRVFDDDWIGFAHEDWVPDYLEGLLPEQGVFVDVGAHVGRYALRLARKASRVVAVEPFPAGLFAHLALNSTYNVEIVRMAAWDGVERLAAQGHGGSNPLAPDADGHVVGAPLDDVVQQADLVKIDVEGAEGHVLRGMTRLLRESRPLVFVEMHDKTYEGVDPQEVYDAFRAAGYTTEHAGDWNEQYYVLGRPS